MSSESTGRKLPPMSEDLRIKIVSAMQVGKSQIAQGAAPLRVKTNELREYKNFLDRVMY